MDQQDQKREQILEAALKRFAHFGLNKTTMNEIARDLNFSKALLYYYFPDKLSLYTAVMEKVFAEIAGIVNKAIDDSKTALDAIDAYFNVRLDFLEKYFPLLDFNKFIKIDKYQDLKAVLDKANTSDIDHLKCIMEIGVKTGEYEISDPQYTAKLLFDALLGIRILYININQDQFGIDKEFLNMITSRQKEIMEIFLRGVSKK